VNEGAEAPVLRRSGRKKGKPHLAQSLRASTKYGNAVDVFRREGEIQGELFLLPHQYHNEEKGARSLEQKEKK